MSDYRVALVESTADPAFDAAFALFEAEFGARGELERRSVIEGWLERGPVTVDGLEHTYHLYAARDAGGAIAGVRDCHLVIDRGASRGVLYLAHVLVLPAHRRRGVAGRLRDAPTARLTESLPGGQRIVVGEMEHPVASDAASIVRLVAYGRAGFAAIDPRAFPYHQPDFREPSTIASPAPVPLLAIASWLGHEDAQALPKTLARAVLRHVYAVFASHCDPAHLASPYEIARAALEAWPEPTVPLLPLPASVADRDALAPLALGARGDR